MSIAGRPITELPPKVIGPAWKLRWTGSASSWSGRFDQAALGGRRLAPIEFAIAVTFAGPDHVELDAWLELPVRREPVFSARELRAAIAFDGRLLHVDVQDHDGAPLLALSLDPHDERLVYVRTPLVDRAGLPAGTLDPPTIQRDAGLEADAASA